MLIQSTPSVPPPLYKAVKRESYAILSLVDILNIKDGLLKVDRHGHYKDGIMRSASCCNVDNSCTAAKIDAWA